MKKFLLPWLLLAVAQLFAAPVTSAIVSAKTILVVGDSLSAAYNMKPEQGWVHLMQQRLQDQFGPNYQVINASISGDTTAGGLARLPQALTRHQPDIVILELGANDGLRGSSLKQMKRNLNAMIEMAHETDAEVILAGMQLPPNYGRAYTDRFQGVFEDLAEDSQIRLIPFLLDNVGGVNEMIQADGLHPNEKAQPIILENVYPHLLALLR